MLRLLACVLIVATPIGQSYDGRIRWDAGFPKAGVNPGQLVVRGSVRPCEGYHLISATVHCWPKDGGVRHKAVMTLKGQRRFGPTVISNLPAGEYNIVVAFNEKCGDEVTTLTSNTCVVTVR